MMRQRIGLILYTVRIDLLQLQIPRVGENTSVMVVSHWRYFSQNKVWFFDRTIVVVYFKASEV